jgi:hypothetical protein
MRRLLQAEASVLLAVRTILRFLRWFLRQCFLWARWLALGWVGLVLGWVAVLGVGPRRAVGLVQLGFGLARSGRRWWRRGSAPQRLGCVWGRAGFRVRFVLVGAAGFVSQCGVP